ncbi:MAG TPA: glutathione transferase [Polyangiaceae bacterium]
MLTLFGETQHDSPFVFTVFVALKQKGLPFELHPLDLSAGAQRAAAYAESSLTSRVPSIALDGFTLSESLAIVEYLDEVRPAPEYPALLPRDVAERARARQVLGWLRSDLATLRRERPSSSIFLERARAPLSPAAQADAEKLLRIASTLLAGGRAQLFEEWSIADADLAFALQRLIANSDPVPELLRRYALAQWARPSIAAWVALERPARAGAITGL